MDEFSHLNEAIEQELFQNSLKNLTEKAKDLRSRYRDRKEPIANLMQSKEEKLAYVGYRMKATLGAIHFVLKQLKKEIKDFEVKTILDLGAGPGTSLWSFPLVFDTLEKITLLERDLELMQMGKRLFSRSEISFETKVLWNHADFVTTKELDQADLILFSYSFGEIDPRFDEEVLKKVFHSAGQYIVMIEPGTPVGYQRILKARKTLIDLGCHTLAPCPHDKVCPLTPQDWCNFSTRIQRTSIQRVLKQGTLNFEDEKFSYIVMGKKKAQHVVERALEDPKVLKEKVIVKLCVDEGLRYQEVPRRDSERYKKAKKLKNGDNFIIEIN